MPTILLILWGVFWLSFAFEVKLHTNYPLKKNNFLKVINEKNYKKIIEILRDISEFKRVDYKLNGSTLYIYIEKYPLIKKIEITGNVYLRDGDIKNILGIEEGMPLIIVDEKNFEEILLQAYRRIGFLGAKVRVDIDINQKGEVYIKIKIEENNLYFLGDAEFLGREKLSKRELINASGLVIGRVFNISRVEDAEEKLEEYYRRKGFFQSFVFLKEVKRKTLKKRFMEALFPETEDFLNKLSLGIKNLIDHPLATLKAIIGDVKVGVPVYEVFEGEKFYIKFKGNNFFSEKILFSLFDLKSIGLDIFTLEKVKEKIEKLYEEKGFFDVSVDYFFHKNIVTFQIREGNRYRAVLILEGKRYTFPYDKEKIHKLVDEKLKELKSIGYINARVEVIENVDKKQKIVKIFPKFEKGFKYIIAEIKINDTLFEELQQRVNHKLPSTLSYKFLDELYREIHGKLREMGYFDAQVNTTIKMEKVGDSIVFVYTIKIKRGKRYGYGETIVYGANKTKIKEIKYMLVKTDKFLKDAEEESVWNLMESGIFRSVRLDNYIDRESKKVHRLISVQENKRGAFELSVGYSTFEGIKVDVGLTLRNLLGIGLINDNRYTKSQRFELYSFSLKDNFFFSRHYFTELRLFKSYENHKFYDLYSQGISYTLGYRFNPKSLVSLSFTSFRAKTEGEEEREGNFKKLTFTSLVRERIKLSFSKAYGKRNYSKFEVSTKLKKPLFMDTGGIRLKTSYGYVSKKAPIFERFFLGGYFNMRGYTYESIGGPYGGRQFLYISPEIFLIYKKNIELISFFEFGKTGNRFSELYKNMKKNIGFSLGFRTPVGLIRGDVAYPLDDTKIKPSRLKFYITVDLYF